MGAFCDIYGNTKDNKVLEYCLENSTIDFAVGDLAEELEISRPKAYEAIGTFEKKDISLEHALWEEHICIN